MHFELNLEPGQRAAEAAAAAEGLNEHRTHNKEILWDLGLSQTFGQCQRGLHYPLDMHRKKRSSLTWDYLKFTSK